MGSPTRYMILHVSIFGLLLVVFPGRTAAKPLDLEERIACQRAIEAVYWRHRIWPAVNPGTKPALSEVLSEVELRRKVEGALLKSNALAHLWGRPITAAQLTAEISRMAQRTKDPQMLREVWAALGRDPVLVAECLARPLLADRLIRNWYAFDDRFHGEARRRAESELALHGTLHGMQATSGQYEEQVWRRLGEFPATGRGAGDPKLRTMGREEWRAEVARLRHAFGLGDLAQGAELDGLPVGVLTPLQEDESGFHVLGVLRKDTGQLELASVSWPKRSFDEWWEATSSSFSTSLSVETALGDELPELVQTTCSDDTWSPMRHRPKERDGHIAVWTGSEMIIWGGAFCAFDGNIPGGLYDPATDSWITINATDAPPNRYGATGVWTGTELIVWGGGWCGPSGSGGVENDGGRYNPATDAWTPTSLTGDVPSARVDHTAVWSGSEMIIWGGTSSYGWCPGTGEQCTETGARYDPETDSWAPVTTLGAPVGRRDHTAVWSGSEMIVWGGERAGQRFDDGARYDPSENAWSPMSSAGAPEGRVRHTAVWTGTEMIVWGGCRGACTYPELDSGGRYDPVADAWRPTSLSGAPYQRHDHSAVWTGSKMIVWGGCVDNECSDFRSTGGRYDPVGDEWSPTATTGAPGARAQHTAVWTGTEMIVWGGCHGGECVIELSSGGRYDPDDDSWVPTSGESSPTRTQHHTAVWTGSELIIWGGSSASTSSIGKRYDPATDHWINIDGFGREKRNRHVAVWTGSEMIVWGGSVPYHGSSNTGERYDPLTDSSAPTKVAGAPDPRAFHTAVWTGTEMIVWGGADGPALDTGGRYDPIADGWTATTTVNVPSARLDHSAVWSGDEMIVWGGRPEFAPSPSSGLNTGGRYDPAHDTWEATATTAAPSPRLNQVTVWSGQEMIVWGGENGGIALGDGARYRPATDAWVPVSTSSAPEARTGHSGVWTGTEMIVWGGEPTPFPLWPADEALRTGGRYDPAANAWRSTSTESYAPAERTGHTATWSGARMFVFGGASPSTEPGAAYCADAAAVVGVGPPGSPSSLEFALRPNPARGSVTLAFDLDHAAEATVKVFDLAGREVAHPVSGERMPPGITTRLWQPDGLPEGIYFLHVVVDGRDMVRRLVLLTRP